MAGKWYACVDCAEGVNGFVAFLTDEEARAVEKFLEFQKSDSIYTDYGGTCEIKFPGFSNREDAVEEVRDWWNW